MIDLGLTLVALIVLPILAVILRKIGKRVRRGTRGSLQAQEELLRIAGESLQGLRAVEANTGERDSLRRFHHVNKRGVTVAGVVRSGFAHGPASATTTTAKEGGVVQLVTPIRMTSGFTVAPIGIIATLRVVLVPEPGTALLLGTGVIALAWMGRRRQLHGRHLRQHMRGSDRARG